MFARLLALLESSSHFDSIVILLWPIEANFCALIESPNHSLGIYSSHSFVRSFAPQTHSRPLRAPLHTSNHLSTSLSLKNEQRGPFGVCFHQNYEHYTLYVSALGPGIQSNLSSSQSAATVFVHVQPRSYPAALVGAASCIMTWTMVPTLAQSHIPIITARKYSGSFFYISQS